MVHVRRNKKQAHDRLDRGRQAKVAVLKLAHENIDQIKREEGGPSWPNQRNHDAPPKKRGEQNLARMKTRGRRDVEVAFGVVHTVKSPQKRDAVVGPMQGIDNSVKANNQQNCMQQEGHIHLIEQADAMCMQRIGVGRDEARKRCRKQRHVQGSQQQVFCVVAQGSVHAHPASKTNLQQAKQQQTGKEKRATGVGNEGVQRVHDKGPD